MAKTLPEKDLEALVARLPQPTHQLFGKAPSPLVLPQNIVCFQRQRSTDLNQPRRGRALHHRFVLILALKTGVKVWVDNRAVPLREGEGMLIFPFEFHHYADAQREDLSWLFITFELAETEPLESLRGRPFRITAGVRGLITELVAAYQEERGAELPVLLLSLLLARLRRLKGRGPAPQRVVEGQETGLMIRVNQVARRGGKPVGIQEIAKALGISPSHLRARFKASCGISIGRHLRRLRLEQACGLLRLGPQRVSEVAELCGFKSIFAFSRAFRHAYGVSPLAFRNRGRTG